MQGHGASRQMTKLKIAAQLQDLLDTTRAPVPCSRPGRGNDSEAEEWSVLKTVTELRQCWRRCLSLCCYVGAVILKYFFLVDNTQR